jgi:hypothetical protein
MSALKEADMNEEPRGKREPKVRRGMGSRLPIKGGNRIRKRVNLRYQGLHVQFSRSNHADNQWINIHAAENGLHG